MSFYTPEFVQSMYHSSRSTWRGFVTGISIGIGLAILANIIFGKLTEEREIISYILILSIVVAAVALIYSFRLYNERVKDAVDDGMHLPDKMNRHRNALVLYLVICCIPIYISVFGFVITGNYYLFVVVAMSFGAVLIKAPTKEKMISELHLTSRDRADLYA